MKELSKINEAISVVEVKLQTILNNTKCKSYVMHSHNSNLAEFRHEQQNKIFELLSRNTHVTCNESAYGQMIACVTKDNAQGQGTHQKITHPVIRKNPTRASATATTNITCPTQQIFNGQMVIKCHENLSFTIAPPAVHPNACTVNEIIKIFHEFRNLKKVKG